MGTDVVIPPPGEATRVCVGKGKLGRGIDVGTAMEVGMGKLGKLVGNVVPVASAKEKKFVFKNL
jgi:hypothetical protein